MEEEMGPWEKDMGSSFPQGRGREMAPLTLPLKALDIKRFPHLGGVFFGVTLKS